MPVVSKKKKGFKNLYDPIGTIKSDFPKPHRKDLMTSIFRDDFKKLHQETKRVTEAALTMADFSKLSHHGMDLSFGVDVRLRRVNPNPMANAIDQYHSSKNLLYTIRSPIKVPPNYEKKLRDLETIGKQFKVKERIKMEEESELEKARIKLRFDSHVKDAMELGVLRETKKTIEREESIVPFNEPKVIEEAVVEPIRSSLARRTPKDRQSPFPEVILEDQEGQPSRPTSNEGKSVQMQLPELPPIESLPTTPIKETNRASIKIQVPVKIEEVPVIIREDSIGSDYPKSPRISNMKPNPFEPDVKSGNKRLDDMGKSPKDFLTGRRQSRADFQAIGTFMRGHQTFLKRDSHTSNHSESNSEHLPITSESRLSRNVPYMLEIWAKAEGIDLKELIGKKQETEGSFMNLLEKIEDLGASLDLVKAFDADSKKISIKAADQRKHARRLSQTEGFFQKLKDTKGRLSSLGERITESQSQLAEADRLVPDYAKTISGSTFDLIKRISKDTTNEDNDKIRSVVEKTLTGYDSRSGKWDIVEPIFFNTHTTRKNRRAASPFKNMTPGTCTVNIGSYIAQDGSLLPVEKNVIVRDCDKPFEVALPNPTVDLNSKEQREEQPEEEEQQFVYKETLPDEIKSRIQDILGDEVIVPKSENKTNLFHPIVLKNTEKEQNAAVKSTRSFHLKRFTSALRLRTLEEYKGEETETWNYYLDSHLPTITCIPEYQSSDWTQIFNTLVSCLRQEKHSNLQYEAVCGIISLKAVKNLKRWDRIAYTKVLDEMLSLGTPKQKELAAIQCLETNDIDVRVIQQLRLGLGDTDEQRRKESIEVLGKLGVEFAKHVIQVLVQDAKHSSWRVRFDVATLLRVWIPRVAPRAMPPPPPRDPDALDTDNEEMLKALFPTGMAKHGGSSDGRLLSNAIMLSTNSITDYPGDEELHDKCIQILLEMMSNDWSLEVRGMAANSLADLQQGKSVLDWIVKSLRSADPTKRVDALKCLTHMATIPKERIDDYVKCFKDPYSSVKIEACRVLLFNKVACSIKSDDPKIVMALLDMMDDSEFKVRAYAVKAIGLSKSKPAKVRETLNWALQHDTHPAVRAEAIRAVSNLGLIQEEQLKNGVMTLLTADSCEKVRREAEKALSKCSVIYKTVSDDSREVQITVDGNPVNPYPHILSEKTKEEAQIFLRNSLVNDQEATNVIDQVRSLSTKEAIFKQVEEMSVNTDQVQVHGLDLDFDATFRPSVKEIHKFATKKKYLEDIEYDRDGIPVLKG